MSDYFGIPPHHLVEHKECGVEVTVYQARRTEQGLQVMAQVKNGHSPTSAPVLLDDMADVARLAAHALPAGDEAARQRFVDTVVHKTPHLSVIIGEVEAKARYGGTRRNGKTPEPEPEATQPSGKPYIISMRDFLDEPHEEREDLVQDLIPMAQAGLIVGAGALGKTLLCMQLAKARARGTTFLGRQTVPGKTLLCLFDDARALTKQRCHDIFEPTDDVVLIAARYERDMYPEIAAYVAAEEPGLVVIDTLATIEPPTPGAENDPATMKSVMEPYIKLAGNEVTSVIFLHHDNADGGVRGTTAIQDNVQWTLKINAMGLNQQGRHRIQCSMRWKYEPIPDFFLTMGNGEFTPDEAPPAPSGAAHGRHDYRCILDVMGGDKVTIEEIDARLMAKREVQISLQTVRREVLRFVAQGAIIDLGPVPIWTKRGAIPHLYGRAAAPDLINTITSPPCPPVIVNNNLRQNGADCRNLINTITGGQGGADDCINKTDGAMAGETPAELLRQGVQYQEQGCLICRGHLFRPSKDGTGWVCHTCQPEVRD